MGFFLKKKKSNFWILFLKISVVSNFLEKKNQNNQKEKVYQEIFQSKRKKKIGFLLNTIRFEVLFCFVFFFFL